MLPLVQKSTLDLPPYQTPRQYMQPGEQEVLIALIASVDPATVVEVGVNRGLTARALLRNVPTIQRYIGIDIGVGYQFELPAQASERPERAGELAFSDPRFELLLRDEGEMPTSADAVFIDGDHGYQSVMRDALWAAGIVNPGGIIVYHDYTNWTVDVTKALDELHATGGRDLYHVNGTWLVFERR